MKFGSLFAGLLLVSQTCAVSSSRTPDRGLNLPPTQGTTRDGAFFQGTYQYAYVPAQVTWATGLAGFSALRLAVNVETAGDNQSLQRHKDYIDSVGGRGIICMFDTSTIPGASWPRSGRVTEKLAQVAQAWRQVHNVFSSYGDSVLYELFNEPWGYQSNATEYVNDMRSIIQMAGLPANRSILAGLYGSADVQSVAKAGWQGYLAYHAYSFWLPEGQRTRKGFSQLIQSSLAGLSSRVFITEFGTGLDGLTVDIDKYDLELDVLRHVDKQTSTSDWQMERNSNASVRSICAAYPHNSWCTRHNLQSSAFVQDPNNLGADVSAHTGSGTESNLDQDSQAAVWRNETMAFLRGLRDALLVFQKQGNGVRGLYHWHGWHNGDTWDFWDAANARSSRIIQMIMSDLGKSAESEDEDMFLSDDYVEDEQQVHMMVMWNLQSGFASSAECPVECTAARCQPGNANRIGGKLLTGNVCTHNCSMPYSGIRYCGTGEEYENQAVQCGGCAHPFMCAGLPCSSDNVTGAAAARRASRQTFLQKHTIQVHRT